MAACARILRANLEMLLKGVNKVLQDFIVAFKRDVRGCQLFVIVGWLGEELNVG